MGQLMGFYAGDADAIGAAAGATLPAAGAISAEDLALPSDSTTAMGAALRFLASLTGLRPAPTVGFLQAVVSSLHTYEARVDPALGAAPRSTATTVTPAKNTKKATGRPRSTPARATTTTTAPQPTSTAGTSLSGVINAVTV